MPQDQAYTTHTYQHGNIEIVVYRPILEDDERKKREKNLERALMEYGKAMVRNQKMKGE